MIRDAHTGQTAVIVGRGPSLLRLHPADFGTGPVIALNHAIIQVRRMEPLNPVYSMQKDGCIPHGREASVPLGCVCPSDRMVAPMEPETLLLSAAESGRCFPDYPRRYVFDPAAFGLRWHTMSAVVAVRLAREMGCTSIRMLAHDAYAHGDLRRVDRDGSLAETDARAGYVSVGRRVERYAREAGMAIAWR